MKNIEVSPADWNKWETEYQGLKTKIGIKEKPGYIEKKNRRVVKEYARTLTLSKDTYKSWVSKKEKCKLKV
jgi:hypothetical protein